MRTRDPTHILIRRETATGAADGPERGRLLGLLRHECRRRGMSCLDALDAVGLPRVRVRGLSTRSLWDLLALLVRLPERASA